MEDKMAEILTDETFVAKVEKGSGLALVDFYADWCVPCQQQGPIIEKLAAEYEGKALICKINTDNSPQTAVKYGVMSIPTIMLFKDGIKQEESLGVTDKATLEAMLAKYL